MGKEGSEAEKGVKGGGVGWVTGGEGGRKGGRPGDWRMGLISYRTQPPPARGGDKVLRPLS